MNNKNNFSHLLLKFWSHLHQKRHRQFGMVLVLMLISTLADVISLGAVFPFIGVLVAPEKILSYPLISDIAQFYEINSAKELVLPLTVVFASTAIVAGALRIFLLWISVRLAVSIGTDLSLDVYNRTLHQPYKVHVSRNSSGIISGITGKVNSVVSMVLLPMLTLLSSMFLLMGVTLTLFVIDPLVATIVTVGFGSVYGFISLFVRHRLKRNSELVAQEQTQVIKALQEGLGGIRDVLLDGTQKVYSNIYRKADYPLRRAQGNNTFIIGSPRFAIEALGIVLIVLLAYVLSLQIGGIIASLPLLGVIALGAQRLLPALQQCYSAWSTMVGNHASLEDVLVLLKQPLPKDTNQTLNEPLFCNKSIDFNNVSFRYSQGDPLVLNDINITIPSGVNVGIVGSTGSGKSTLLDLLMGLIEPSDGELLVDGKKINRKNLRAWQKTISHVPQNIFLTDASVSENIAFGVSPENIDLTRVKESAKLAQISEYIESCQERYNTVVGERGISLSGGQRQRLGIARALYKNANILVFDEATSALDNRTEKLVMNAIGSLERNLTVFFIAHRLTTVKECDVIIEMDDGKIIAQGTYDELLMSSPSFLNMVNAV
jgi:ATP-binding cassette, subfamily B, bacterial PglK